MKEACVESFHAISFPRVDVKDSKHFFFNV